VPAGLLDFARAAAEHALREPRALARALGEWLTEPKDKVWFAPGTALQAGQGARLDRRTRMLFDADHVFINGESFRAAGRDAQLMQRLANARALAAADVARLSGGAWELLMQWSEDGWLHADSLLAPGVMPSSNV
jgi:50S ribosomal protein L16 3-hydroxylase